jgi:CheY-like chemotaxis protein
MQCLQHDPHIADRKNRFLLAVDSSSDDLFYTSMLLQRFAYDVCTAKDVSEAMDFMTVATPALVVADVTEEGTNGPELLRRMREIPRLSAIPVILLSRSADVSVEQQCRLAGCTAYLRKPVQAEALFRAVQEAVEPMPRKNIRIAVSLRARLGADAASPPVYATMLSEYGMFMRTLDLRPVNTHLAVTLEISGKAIFIDTLVLYSFSFGEGPLKEPGMGLKFATISPEDADFIRSFIRGQLEQGLVAKAT